MASFQNGIDRAISEGIFGIISYVIILTIFEKIEIPFAFIFANICMIILIIILITKMDYWSIPYTFGWIIGLFIIGKSFFGLLELIICIIAGLIYLFIKFKNKF